MDNLPPVQVSYPLCTPVLWDNITLTSKFAFRLFMCGIPNATRKRRREKSFQFMIYDRNRQSIARNADRKWARSVGASHVAITNGVFAVPRNERQTFAIQSGSLLFPEPQFLLPSLSPSHTHTLAIFFWLFLHLQSRYIFRLEAGWNINEDATVGLEGRI
jgi:hypothetical protein